MKSLVKFFLLSFCLVLFCLPSVKAQVGIVDRNAEAKPKLLILGTYHMAMTTSNVFNAEVDDVTTPERQEQIMALLEILKKFNPTKIALEVDIEDDAKANESYKKYLAGDFELTRNEVHQLGFRLAKMLGHKKIYGIDWGIFPEDPVYNYVKYAAKYPELDEYLKKYRAASEIEFNEQIKTLSSLSITDQLIYMNQPERMKDDHQGYYEIMRIGRGGEYSGADYLSWWYGRNLKILVNIIRIIDSLDERILVIYGAGHAKLLNQQAEESEFFDVISPLEYLSK